MCKGRKGEIQQHLHNPPRTSTHHMMLQKKVAEYLIADMRPFSTVESKSFRDLCTALDPKFDLPGKTAFSQTIIPKMCAETKKEVHSLLENTSSVAITADAWTSLATESYMTITGHFINENWEMMNVGLREPHS